MLWAEKLWVVLSKHVIKKKTKLSVVCTNAGASSIQKQLVSLSTLAKENPRSA